MANENAFRILLVENDGAVRAALEDFLSTRGFDVTSTTSASSAIRHIREETANFDLVLSDLTLPENGLEVLRFVLQRHKETQVVVMTSFATLDAAIDSIRQGAFDYITKPFKFAQIEVLLNKVAERRKLIHDNAKLSERVQSLYTRLDMLKDNRDKMDRFMRETSEELEIQAEKLDNCLNLLQRICAKAGLL